MDNHEIVYYFYILPTTISVLGLIPALVSERAFEYLFDDIEIFCAIAIATFVPFINLFVAVGYVVTGIFALCASKTWLGRECRKVGGILKIVLPKHLKDRLGR